MCLIQVGTEDGNEMANTGARSTTEADPEESFHAVSPCLEAPRSPVPMVSIVEATRDVVYEMGIHRVGLFGTRFTMQWCFYPEVFRRFSSTRATAATPRAVQLRTRCEAHHPRAAGLGRHVERGEQRHRIAEGVGQSGGDDARAIARVEQPLSGPRDLWRDLVGPRQSDGVSGEDLQVPPNEPLDERRRRDECPDVFRVRGPKPGVVILGVRQNADPSGNRYEPPTTTFHTGWKSSGAASAGARNTATSAWSSASPRRRRWSCLQQVLRAPPAYYLEIRRAGVLLPSLRRRSHSTCGQTRGRDRLKSDSCEVDVGPDGYRHRRAIRDPPQGREGAKRLTAVNRMPRPQPIACLPIVRSRAVHARAHLRDSSRVATPPWVFH